MKPRTLLKAHLAGVVAGIAAIVVAGKAAANLFVFMIVSLFTCLLMLISAASMTGAMTGKPRGKSLIVALTSIAALLLVYWVSLSVAHPLVVVAAAGAGGVEAMYVARSLARME